MDVDNMHKNILMKIIASVVIGGVIYCLFVMILNYFAPITGLIAGLVSGTALIILSNHFKNNNEFEISIQNLLFFIGVGIISLLIGYILIYFFKTEIIHGTRSHPKDFISIVDFFVSTLGIPDILSTIIGGIISISLSNKIGAVYRYFRRTPSV